MSSHNKTLLTDYYQLTMNAAYFYSRKDDTAVFDLFIRALPDGWGYFIANGIEDAVDYLTGMGFEDDELRYLKQQGFGDDYLDFLRCLRFEGDVEALRDGTPVFPNEPLLRITAKRTQAQLAETALLNIVNYQTMIATKASRVVIAAAPGTVVDFGLRRAHGEDAGMQGARAAYVAGAVATSNVKAGMRFGIPVAGTHGHSFVMSFESELDAFRSYVKTFPERPTLLLDTYDTLAGARNACIVGRELELAGGRLGAVRLDSGDLALLSGQVRNLLDRAGLEYVRIVVSSDLNEYKIAELKCRGAPVDAYGVGTELITAKPVAAISGVYKLARDSGGPRVKLSEGKQTLPGIKQVYRQSKPGTDGLFLRDVVALEHEQVRGTPLLEPVIRRGQRVRPAPSIEAIRHYCLAAVDRLPEPLKQVHAQGSCPVDMAPQLKRLVRRLYRQHHG